MNKSNSLGEEKILKLLFKLSTPAIIAMLVSAIYNLVDTFFVGMLNDNGAMGAVSIAFPIFMVIVAVGQTMGVGSGAYISRLLGSKDIDQAKRVAVTSLITSAVVGLIITLTGLVFIDEILTLTGASGSLFAQSKEYLLYILMASVFTILNMNMNNLVRAEGNAMYSMIAISLGALVNVVLDPLLIFTFDMGVAGASLATAIAQGVSTLFLFTYYITGRSTVGLNLGAFTPKWSIYREILITGLPSFARQFLSSLALALVNVAVIPFGDAAVASIGIILRVTSLGTYVLFGIAQGFQPIVAYNFGAKQVERVKEAIKYAVILSSGFCLLLSGTFIVFARRIIGVFSSHPEVVEMGSRSLIIMIALFVANGFQIIITTLFQSLGHGKQAFILAVSRQGLFFAPAVLILPKIWGFYGVSYSLVIADILAFILTFGMYKKLQRDFRKARERGLQFA